MAEQNQDEIPHPNVTILPDHAIAKNDPAMDALALNDRLGPVFDILRHKSPQAPMAIAVYGDWGAGKSSAMRWLEGKLDQWNNQENRGDHKIVRTIWFDPWKYHSREDVWRGLIAEVIIHCIDVGNLDKHNAPKRLLTAAAKQFGPFLGRSFLHALANVAAKVKTPGVELEVDGSVFRDIYDEYRQVSQPEKAYLNDFEQTLEHWVEETIPPATERMVIFIDDLDRCLPEVALEVLEALKLYLNIQNLIFMVGVDRSVVDEMVKSHYEDQKIDPDKAARYLDKMFQVEVTVSPSEAQIADFLPKQVKSINDATDGYWDAMLPEKDEDSHRAVLHKVIGSLCYHNPREIKRLLNGSLLAGRAAARAEALVDEGEESERFAQGAAVFLIWHVLEYFHKRSGQYLRRDKVLQFLEAWSKMVRSHREAAPPGSADGDESQEAA